MIASQEVKWVTEEAGVGTKKIEPVLIFRSKEV